MNATTYRYLNIPLNLAAIALVTAIAIKWGAPVFMPTAAQEAAGREVCATVKECRRVDVEVHWDTARSEYLPVALVKQVSLSDSDRKRIADAVLRASNQVADRNWIYKDQLRNIKLGVYRAQ